jgi:hypothetical protein
VSRRGKCNKWGYWQSIVFESIAAEGGDLEDNQILEGVVAPAGY